MTVEERIQAVEGKVENQGDRLERHSKRLEKLERSNEDIQDIKAKVSSMESDMKKIKAHQASMDSKLMKKTNLTLVLLFVIVGLVTYIAIKAPETAKEVVGITSTAVTTGLKTL